MGEGGGEGGGEGEGADEGMHRDENGDIEGRIFRFYFRDNQGDGGENDADAGDEAIGDGDLALGVGNERKERGVHNILEKFLKRQLASAQKKFQSSTHNDRRSLDFQRALSYFARAAKLGHLRSLHRLAMMELYGLGGYRNF